MFRFQKLKYPSREWIFHLSEAKIPLYYGGSKGRWDDRLLFVLSGVLNSVKMVAIFIWITIRGLSRSDLDVDERCPGIG
jgi:hypothetical protein